MLLLSASQNLLTNLNLLMVNLIYLNYCLMYKETELFLLHFLNYIIDEEYGKY